MLKITFKSGRRTFTDEVDPSFYPPPRGVDLNHWTRPLSIEGDDLEGLVDHLVAVYANDLAERDCPEFLLDCGPEGCTIQVESI